MNPISYPTFRYYYKYFADSNNSVKVIEATGGAVSSTTYVSDNDVVISIDVPGNYLLLFNSAVNVQSSQTMSAAWFKNGVEVPFTERTTTTTAGIMTLVGFANLAEGDVLEVKKKVSGGTTTLGNKHGMAIRLY